jgi:formylglycine-generating enzyme required for sulfatase activity
MTNKSQIVELDIEFTTQSVDTEGHLTTSPALHARQRNVMLNDTLVLEMVLISGGSFLMGTLRGLGYPDEQPQHFVQAWPFWISRSAITQEQWQAVMGTLPCRFKGPNLPVDTVTWIEANRFCEKLSGRSRHAIRLPSEAQWEYACRADTRTAFSCGPTITSDLANYNGEFSYRGEPKGVYRHVTTPGGTFPPNGFGLYDMHGNLWEWCADVWHDDYSGAPADASAWITGAPEDYRVARGGSWHDIPAVCRSAARLKLKNSDGDEMTGFRVIME